jgi:hypothetical protein
MTASLTDLLSAAKNIAQAINDAARAYVGVQGSQVSNSVAAQTQIVTGAGRVCMMNVIVAGTAAGRIYDTADASNSNNVLHIIAPIPVTVGSFFVNMPFNNGLLIVPGAGQTVAVSYSTGAAAGDQTASSSGRQLRGF